ncbi:midasin-like [Homalodisca vitripennis]|uniref:midasin-like n=1 Tax=Homalodisca vitripennis TaxID=197043 RepID=UPI001EEBB7A8|nr:midasin-like [Homalodisca vitripennis]
MENNISDSFNIRGFKKLFSLGVSNELKHLAERFSKVENWDKDTTELALTELHRALLNPAHTIHVAQTFPEIVLVLLSLPTCEHIRKCVAIGKLLDVHPDALKYSLKYFENNPAPWEEIKDVEEIPKKKRKEVMVSDIEIVETCFRFLRASANHFRTLWKWSEFTRKFLQHEDNHVKRLACHCTAIVTGMDEVQLRTMVSRYCDFPTQGQECDPLLSGPQMLKLKGTSSNITNPNLISCEKICPSVVSVAGISLPVCNPSQATVGCLVPVQSMLHNLRQAALGVASGKAVCLMGSVGSGKTALVDHLAQLTGRREVPHLLKVQLGDETDAKMLLGAYCCTDIPGEFVWRPGVLTQAVLGGHWLLLEDIDSATSDVIAVLASLLETGAINVPGYRDHLQAAPGFQIFFTYRLMSSASGLYKKRSNVCELLEKHWMLVNMEHLTCDELVHIIQVKFPVLQTVASRMVALYLKFSAGDHDGTGSHSDLGRLTSTRDLMKWCARAVIGFDVSSPESALKVLQDAIDIFCCNINNPENRVILAKSVSSNLGIVQTKAEYFLSSYKPQSIKLIDKSCIVGRISIPIKHQNSMPREDVVRFAQTRPAACLLERVAACLSLREPVLLVGETGTGKTSTLQLLARHTRNTLVVVNMNQQSDSADLLGGFKPVDVKFIIVPIRNEFERLFRSFFKVEQNLKFLEHISNCFTGKRWTQLLQLMKHSQAAAVKRLLSDQERNKSRLAEWRAVGEKIHRLETQLKQNQAALAFTFVEGTLVRALKEGWWVLLDEINLASAETLQCLSGLLESGNSGSILTLEKGDTEAVQVHPDFRLLAAMNPATDVGKKDLPPGIRNRFTELYVDELTDRTDLGLLVSCYLPDLPPTRVDSIVRFYLDVRSAANTNLCDATGHKPHYSLRTLCRALVVAAGNSCGNMQRSLHTALCLSFLTQLDNKSHGIVLSLINRAVVEGGDIKSVLGQPIPEPAPLGSNVCFEGYWVKKGKLKPTIPDNYILTPCVRRNLQDLSRIVSMSQYPVLIQGDTCVGKTSLITFLAVATGNRCVRINNHEHTDLQEYIGSYCADHTGQLVFREGVLVQAMRQGHWIILDELNLAPTDVLEALNRVLDDNRELYIPETQETVKANAGFRLFATQNPPGLYGGRKVLSRAFRNRFVELHFNEIPGPELETILHQRCAMPLSYCKKLIAIMSELQLHRKGSAAFAGKQGFITLRDLFRWGERYRLASQKQGKFYDWDQHIADEGYLVLAGRVRKSEESETIRRVIEKHIKRKVEPERLFSLSELTSPVTRHILERVVGGQLPHEFRHIVWTFNLRRLAVLVGKACEFQEAVLLVGETGCGKTTVCQLLASLNKQQLFSVNCHQHSESSDFLGALRPVRDRSNQESAGHLFEWVDGPLIQAMRGGHIFLADEISLADDSVLERLNSLLEPERTLLLSEKGAADEQFVVAEENFRFFGTMNPGGDFGKKELSPALRNRLTEVWCEGITERVDWLNVIEHNIRAGLSLGNQQDATSGIGPVMLDFIYWFRQTEIGKRVTVSVRDVLTWVNFINTLTAENLDVGSAYVHGACLTLVDGLGSGSTATLADKAEVVAKLREACLKFLVSQVEHTTAVHQDLRQAFLSDITPEAVTTDRCFGIPPFYIPLGELSIPGKDEFTLGARTTCLNACRLLRALQLAGRAILLEGSPGVGKTSLVAALARASGHPLTRINLSDQTDVSDLFGADLPVEGAEGGTFAWRDGPFLRALRLGHWILLDELNLASQSVLEGLNAVLDHRGELYIPELGRSFTIQSDKTRLFACQNPLRQGGARRGLPQSFLNRFTQVYMEPLTANDLEFITRSLFPTLPLELVQGMVRFTVRLAEQCGSAWGQRGAPWELNLRDLTRWAQTMGDPPHPDRFVGVIYADRMRTAADKQQVLKVYNEELGDRYPLSAEQPGIVVTPSEVVFGEVVVPRQCGSDGEVNIVDRASENMVLRSQLAPLRSLATCVNHNWLSIVVGSSGSGKTSTVRTLAQLCGRKLQVLSVNSAMDTTEILGGFEQVHI